MLICCVKTGDKYDERYVLNLQDGIDRWMRGRHEFVCFTEKPVDGVRCESLPSDLPGWWSKIGLYKLREPLIYFDLDVVITGYLSRLVEWEGFGIIKDWNAIGCRKKSPFSAAEVKAGGNKILTKVFNSSVMKLTGGEGHVWDEFKPVVMDRFRRGGDQRWITRCLPDARTFPPNWFASYKADNCINGIPWGAMAVIFHGEPKMPDCGGWVKHYWQNDKEKD